MRARTSKPTQLPWWLEAGSATCEFCLRTYHYEAGYYCATCDRPVCPVCVMEIYVTRVSLCPACHEEAD